MQQAFFHTGSRRLELELAHSPAPESRELFCPFAPSVHAEVDSVNAATVAWAGTTGLVDARTAPRLEASKVGSLVSRAYPRDARAQLQLAVDWTTFFCLLDDVIERLESPGLSRCVLMLRRWVRGHLDWALETGRYRP